VTVVVAIAADIHGKNHHRDGAFSTFLLDFQLLTPTLETLTCSATQNSDVFWATVGGMGLTGIIVSARFRLRLVESAYVLVDYQRTRNLGETLDIMAQSDDRFEYSVAWLDGLAKQDLLGRSVLMRGNHAPANRVPGRLGNPLAFAPRTVLNLPFHLPSLVLNEITVSAFNALYYALHKDRSDQLVDIDRFFYPLDVVGNWNLAYGRRGFVQYQVVLPEDGGRQGLTSLLERCTSLGRAPFLVVLKRFGESNPGLLSFPMKGYTLAMDLPMTRDLPSFLQDLDDIILAHGGRLYLAKDAVMKPETFAASYPRLDQFRAVKRKLDPKGLVSSSLARRLKICDAVEIEG